MKKIVAFLLVVIVALVACAGIKYSNDKMHKAEKELASVNTSSEYDDINLESGKNLFVDELKRFDREKLYFISEACCCNNQYMEDCDTELYNPVFHVWDYSKNSSVNSTVITLDGFKHIHFVSVLTNEKIIYLARAEDDCDYLIVSENGVNRTIVKVDILPSLMISYEDSVLFVYENADVESSSVYQVELTNGNQSLLINNLTSKSFEDRLMVRNSKILYRTAYEERWALYENGVETDIHCNGICVGFSDDTTVVFYDYKENNGSFAGEFYKYDIYSKSTTKMFEMTTEEAPVNNFVLTLDSSYAIMTISGKDLIDSYCVNMSNGQMIKLENEYPYFNKVIRIL